MPARWFAVSGNRHWRSAGLRPHHQQGNFLTLYLDMHSHSVSSDDSRATVEQYVKWIQVLRKRGHTVDGIVLTEHRKFDFDKD